jgi:hypothetical protein
VRLAKALRVSVTELLGETMSMRQWRQAGQDRFTTREDAEDHARTAGELFVAQYQIHRCAKGDSLALYPGEE